MRSKYLVTTFKLMLIVIIGLSVPIIIDGYQKKGFSDDRSRLLAIGKIPDPGHGVYIGTYDWFGVGLKNFEAAIGKKVAIGLISDIKSIGGEGRLPFFDKAGHEKAYKMGYISVYGIEASPDPESTFTPQDVINGKIDKHLSKIGSEIGKWGKPIFWVYPREPVSQPAWGFDGGGYGPEGIETRYEVEKRDGNLKTEYGDPNKLDGPERYIGMCRHIHDVVVSLAPNITWVAGAIAYRKAGTYRIFYPGDAYADWHAIDVYNRHHDEVAKQFSFRDAIEPAYSDAMKINPNKPVMILEFGVSSKFGDRSAWFVDFFKQLKTNYSKIGAFIYWQMDDFVLLPTSPSAKVWKEEMQKSCWISTIVGD